jgi:hypothetical protein
MKLRIALIALALAVAGCGQQTSNSADGAADGPQLDSPAPESEPSRAFAAANDGARAVAPQLTVSVALRLPDAGDANADAQEVLTLRGDNGFIAEAEVTGAISPATQVQGQTLRAMLNIPVEEPQVLVYRVASEAKPEGRGGLCGANAPAFVVVWEPAGPGDPVMKLLGLTGGQPGAANARACPMLEYRRG